jgi:hypothetical protein
VTVIAFIKTHGDECNYLLPTLVDAAGRYYNKPVRIVQLATPACNGPTSAGTS